MKTMNSKNEMIKAVRTLVVLFWKLVKYGFFSFTVSGEKKDGRTIVRIQAGESHMFNIRNDEIYSFNPDSWDGSRNEDQ